MLWTQPAASNIEKTEREVVWLAYRVTEHLSHIPANTSVKPMQPLTLAESGRHSVAQIFMLRQCYGNQ